MPVSDQEAAWNQSIIADLRAHGGQVTQGPLAGSNLLLMTSTGAKSGLPRTTPIGYTRDGDRYVLVGSNSGLDTQPAWVANVRANPDVEAEVGTETFRATATIAEGSERRRLLDAHIAAIPIFGRYEQMTARQLPVIVLSRVD
jgi:deazaflavin-dependent oxidoreductase (nitroreductase family)